MYIKRTVFCKNRIFVEKIKCYYYNPDACKRARKTKRFATGESKKERNRRRAAQNRKHLIYNNFDEGDMWITLTYDKETVPKSPEEAHKNLTRIISLIQKKLKKVNIPFVYFAKTEAGSGMRVHHHLIIRKNFCVMDTLFEYWKRFGRIDDFREIYDMKSGKLVNYFLDGGNHKGLNFEAYAHSRNLKKPRVETRVMPMKSFRTIPRAPRDENGKEYIVQNLYNGYSDRDGYVYQTYELVRGPTRKEV